MNQVEVKRRQIEICASVIGLINILIFGSKLGNNGITYLIIALECFAFVWTLTAGCLTDTLGKMLRSRIAKGQYKNSLYIRKRVLILQGIVGVVCSILLGILAGGLARNLFKVQHSTFIMMILAPVLALRTISAVLTGFFQGEGSELPAAVAAPLRQLLLMGLGLLFVNILGDYGTKVSNLLGDSTYTAMYGGVGIAVAMVITEILVVLFLAVITLGNKNSRMKRENEGMRQTDSFVNIVKILYGSMGMSVLIRLFEILPLWIGTVFYRKNIADMVVFSENFGMFSGKFLTVCGIPALLICAMIISVNGKSVGAFRKEDYRSAKMIFQCGLHTIVAHGLFLTVFVAIMAEQLAGMVSESNGMELAELFRCGSSLILFVPLYYYLSRIMMRTGRKYHLLGCIGVGNILFIIVVAILLNGGKAGILSLAYAAVAAMAVVCASVGFLCCRLLHTGIEWLQIVAVPVGASCIAGLVSMFLGKLFTPHLGNLVTVFVCFIISFIVYWVILLLLRSFREQELKHIPGGGIIRAAGQTLRVFYMD